MKRAKIEEWLQLQVLNLCLATISKRDFDLLTAKNALYDRVVELVKQAQREAVAGKQ